MKKIWIALIAAIIAAGAGYYFFVVKNNNSDLDTNFAPSNHAVKNNTDTNTSTEKIPTMSFNIEGTNCRDNKYTDFAILKDGKKIASIQGQYCEQKVQFLATNNKGSYFTLPPDGIGGYILYEGFSNLQYLDFATNKISVIDLGNKTSGQGSYFEDITFNPEVTKMAYTKHDSADYQIKSIVIRNLSTSSEKVYSLPASTKGEQMGDLSFSPNQDKLAFATGFGPDNEHGEIYILNISTGQVTLYKSFPSGPHIKGWVNNNEVNWTNQ